LSASCAGTDSPAQQDDRCPARPGQGRNAHGGLSLQRLFVGATLTGDHEVRGLERLREADKLGDDLHAGSHRGRQQAEQTGRRSACGASPGDVGDQPAGGRLDGAPPPNEGRVELLDHRLIGALLRSVRRGRTAWAAERIRHVGCDGERHSRNPRIQAADIHAVKASQPTAAIGQLLAIVVEQHEPELTEKATPAVGGG